MARDKKKSFFSSLGAETLIFPNLISGVVGTLGSGAPVTYPAAVVEPAPEPLEVVSIPAPNLKIKGAEDLDPVPSNPIIAPMKQPLYVSSIFNDPARGGFHPGIDLVGGSNIYAIADGKVTEIFKDYDAAAVAKARQYVAANPPGLRDAKITSIALAMCGTSGGGYIIGYSIVLSGVTYTIRCCHLASAPVDSSGKEFSIGDPVSKGQSLGKMDSTGFVTGDHLHIEVSGPTGPTDPLAFFNSNGVIFPGPI